MEGLTNTNNINDKNQTINENNQTINENTTKTEKTDSKPEITDSKQKMTSNEILGGKTRRKPKRGIKRTKGGACSACMASSITGGKKRKTSRRKPTKWVLFVKKTHKSCKNNKNWSFKKTLQKAAKEWKKQNTK